MREKLFSQSWFRRGRQRVVGRLLLAVPRSTWLTPVVFVRARVRRHTRGVALLLAAVAFSISLVNSLSHPVQTAAATSNTINFQARLEGITGAIAPDGYYNVEFKLYNAETSGTLEWTEDWVYNSASGNASTVCTTTHSFFATGDCRIQVINGYLTANLGALTAFSGINWDQQQWLTMNIGGTNNSGSITYDGEMSPRLQLTAVPYAFRAGQLADPANTGSVLSWLGQGGANTIQIPDAGTNATKTLCFQSDSSCGFVLGSGTAFLQGGNSFTAPADLGTNDANALNLRTNGNTRLTVSTSGDLTFAASNTIGTSLTNGNITLQANGNGIAALDTGASGTVAVGTSANNKTINIGAVSSTANTTAIHIGDTTGNANQTITIGSHGSTGSTLTLDAGTGSTAIQIGNSSTAHGIQIGAGGTGSNAETITIGSNSGTSAVAIQSGTSGLTLNAAGGSSNNGVLVKADAETTAAFQIQAAGSSTPLFNVDSTNSGNVSILTNNGGETGAWSCQGSTGGGANCTTAVNSNGLNAARYKNSTVILNGYIYTLGGLAASGGASQTTVQYAKLNANGTTGAWSTTTLPSARSSGAAVAVNGYIYYLGGIDGSGGSETTVFFAKQSADGTLGPWSCEGSGSGSTVCNMTPTNGNVLPAAANYGNAFTANGYLNMIVSNGTNTVNYYAKLNPDGTTGTWSTDSTNISGVINIAGLAVANGYVYLVGGEDGSGARLNGTYYAAINNNGTLTGTGSPAHWFTGPNLTGNFDTPSAVTGNGYLYVLGGTTGSYVNTVQYAKIGSSGLPGSFGTSSNHLPTSFGWGGSAAANGYLYLTGGYNGSTVLQNVDFVSLARISVAGSLDLVGTSAQDLSGGGNVNGQGGSLTAGNTIVAGTLNVNSTANFLQSVAVSGILSVGGSVTINTASGYSGDILNVESNGTIAFSVDTSGNVRQGNGYNIYNTGSNAPVVYNSSSTLTTSDILDERIIVATTAQPLLSMPTAANIVAAIPHAAVGDTFRFTFINGSGSNGMKLCGNVNGYPASCPGTSTGVTLAITGNQGTYVVSGTGTQDFYCRLTNVTSGSEAVSCY